MSYSWGARTPTPTGGFPAVRLTSSVGAGASPTTQGIELTRLAAELAPMVGVWQRLLVQHVPDRGGRCRTCTKGGTGLPSTPWPCSIHGIADLARRRHDSDDH